MLKSTTDPATARPRSGRRFRSGAALFVCLSAGVFSLLIWAKLRVVTGIPRTAYAEPEAVPPARRASPPTRAVIDADAAGSKPAPAQPQ